MSDLGVNTQPRNKAFIHSVQERDEESASPIEEQNCPLIGQKVIEIILNGLPHTLNKGWCCFSYFPLWCCVGISAGSAS
jgi:hypothetical protein